MIIKQISVFLENTAGRIADGAVYRENISGIIGTTGTDLKRNAGSDDFSRFRLVCSVNRLNAVEDRRRVSEEVPDFIDHVVGGSSDGAPAYDPTGYSAADHSGDRSDLPPDAGPGNTADNAANAAADSQPRKSAYCHARDRSDKVIFRAADFAACNHFHFIEIQFHHFRSHFFTLLRDALVVFLPEGACLLLTPVYTHHRKRMAVSVGSFFTN